MSIRHFFKAIMKAIQELYRGQEVRGEAHPRFMDQRGRLYGMTWCFPRHLRGSEQSELFVDKG